MNYKIIADSCCDYIIGEDTLPLLQRVPLDIELGGRRYTDNSDLDTLALLKDMKNNSEPPKSACPPPEEYVDAFAGEETDIYVVTLSGNLSGSYNSAVLAKDIYNEEKGGKNIHIFDSKSAAAGEVAICLKIKELADSGKSFTEVVSATEKFISELTTMFVLEDLEVLRKNGRLSHLQVIITGALKIRLIMGGRPDGTIGKRGQAFTMQQALDKMVNMIVEQSKKIDCSIRNLVITHCNCPERAVLLMNDILKKCKFMGHKICQAGGVSTMYANNGGIVVSF